MARIRSIKAAIPAATRRAVARRHGVEPGATGVPVFCAYCGAEGRASWFPLHNGRPGAWVHFTLELDHVVAEFNGGDGQPTNIVLACRRCNRSKGHR